MAKLSPILRFDVWPANALRVERGANEGDPIGAIGDVVAGDEYRLLRGMMMLELALCDGPDDSQIVAQGSQLGQGGDVLTLEACHQLMAPDGSLVEVLIVTIWPAGQPAHYVLPLGRLDTGVNYVLLGSETQSAPKRLADIACVSFIKGTHLTLASGAQKRVEDLRAGDAVLTRDNGPQTILWISQNLLRATGALAPVILRQGALNCARDLWLMPHHRLFIWQRQDRLGTGRAEVMVKAGHLVNGDSVLRAEGGFIECYQILLGRHQIIYAEGIAVESMMVTGQTRAALPAELAQDLARDHLADARNDLEIGSEILARTGDDPVRALRAASLGRDPAPPPRRGDDRAKLPPQDD